MKYILIFSLFLITSCSTHKKVLDMSAMDNLNFPMDIRDSFAIVERNDSIIIVKLKRINLRPNQ